MTRPPLTELAQITPAVAAYILSLERVVDMSINKKDRDHMCPICERFHSAPQDHDHHYEWCPLKPLDIKTEKKDG